MLNEVCSIGGPRRVGRPAKSNASSIHNKPDGQSRGGRRRQQQEKQESKNLYTQPTVPDVSSAAVPHFEVGEQLGMEGLAFPVTMDAVAPTVVTSAADSTASELTWMAAGPYPLLPESSPWDVSSSFKHGFAFSNYDWSFNADTAIVASPRALGVTDVCSDPAGLMMPEPGPLNGSIELPDAMAKLSKLNIDIHARVAAVHSHRASLSLESIIYRTGPLYIDNHPLAEFMLRSTKHLFKTLSRLHNSRQSHAALATSRKLDTVSEHSDWDPSSGFLSPLPAASFAQPLPAALTLAITSIFIQLVSLYELYLEHIVAQIQKIANRPISPDPGFDLYEPMSPTSSQLGVLFSNVSVVFLERIEQVLGICGTFESAGTGLFSCRQVDVLWSELDDGFDVVPGHGFMRPAEVRRSLSKAADVLGQLATRQGTPACARM